MEVIWSAVYQKVSAGYTGFVEGLPGNNRQAATLEEARGNLKEAVQGEREINDFLARKTVVIYGLLSQGRRSK